MAEQVQLSDIVIWGGSNEMKSKSPVRWNHDFIIYASYSDTLKTLDNASVLIPQIFGKPIEEIHSKELYDGVYEYKTNEITVEVVDGIEYTEYKLYGTNIDFDAIVQRLVMSGAQMKKPVIPIVIPDRPEVVDLNQLNQLRYLYAEEIKDSDESQARKVAYKSFIMGAFGIIFLIVITVFVIKFLIMTPYQNITPTGTVEVVYLGTIGQSVGYSVDGKLIQYKFAVPIASFGFDSTDKLFKKVATKPKDFNTIEVDKVVTADGKTTKYERGKNAPEVVFERKVTDYTYVNTKPFTFDSYQSQGEADWAKYGELVKGRTDKIIIQGRVIEKEGKYLMVFGNTAALLGTVSDQEPFYSHMQDDLSTITILYALKAKKLINIYGQINRTLTLREGRNSLDKIIFEFKMDYARPLQWQETR